MAYSLAPVIKHKFTDANDNPLSGGKLYSYQAGTTTPQATYTDSTGGTPNANPVILDANGECNLWLDQSLSYKFVLKNSSDVTQWTVDNIIGLLTANAVSSSSLQDGAVTGAAGGGKLAYSAVDGQTALTSPAGDDELLVADVSASGLKKITKSDFIREAVAAKTATYTATATDEFIPCDATSAAFTVNLPAAVNSSGKRLRIKKTDSSFNAITIDANSAETIDGSLTTTLNTRYESVTLLCDGTGWHIVHRHIDQSWNSYTPTVTGSGSNPSLGTSPTQAGYWRRAGNELIGRIEIVAGAGSTAGTGYYSFGLPSGLTIDTTYCKTLSGTISTTLASNTSKGSTFGTGWARDSSSTNGLGLVVAPTTSTVALVHEGMNVNTATTMNQAYMFGGDGSNSIAFGTQSSAYLEFRVPISNWKG